VAGTGDRLSPCPSPTDSDRAEPRLDTPTRARVEGFTGERVILCRVDDVTTGFSVGNRESRSMAGREARVFALLGVFVYLLCVAGYLLFTATGTTFPWIPAVSLGVGLVLFWTVVRGVGTPRWRTRFVVSGSVGLVLYRTWISYRRAGSLIGVDTDGFAVWGRRAIETGDVSAAASPFYSNAPVFHTAIGATSAVTGLGVEESVQLLSYVLAAMMVALAYLLAARTADSLDAGALAAVFAALLAVQVERAIWPVAQSFGMVLFLVVLFFVLTRTTHDTPTRGLYLLVVVVMSLTHKLLVFATLLSVVGVFLVGFLRTHCEWLRSTATRAGPVSHRQAGHYVLLTAVVLLGQWFYLTEWGQIALRDLLALTRVGLDLGESTASGATTEVVAASRPDTGLLSVFAHRSHALVALAVGGVAWLYLLLRDRDALPLLAVTAFFVALLGMLGLPILLGASVQNPVRVYYLVSIPLVVVAARALAQTLPWKRPTRAVALAVLVAGLLAFQAFSAAAVVDLPGQDRVFLEESEVHAKEFTNQYGESTVHTDGYYASETVEFAPEQRATTPEYLVYDECLFNRTNCAVDRGLVSVRAGVEVYRAWGDRWAGDTYALDWDPATELGTDHHQIYSTGTVRVFRP
jgi:hypothetical protein